MGDPHYLGIHNIKVYVTDLDRSLRFYVDQLGFQLAFDARLQSGDRWVAVAPPDGSAVLALVAPKPDSKLCAAIGRMTDIVFVTEDVLAQYHEWSKRGVLFTQAPRLRRVQFERQAKAPWGGVFARFRDPDGNGFTLAGFDAVTREIESQRRIAAAKAEAERRAAQELDIARQVQARLFPQALPPLRTLEYTGACIQARQVGGDYYDFLDFGHGRLGLVIGDIAGKGMAAALLMANLQANLRSQSAVALEDPRRFLQSVNRLFHQNTTEGAYATLFFGEYDDRERRLRYANCGHLSALVLRHDGALERLESTATVLGLFAEWDCSLGECRLDAGDTLALYTDGITEAANAEGMEFGEQRLLESLRRSRGLSPPALATSIVDEVLQFTHQEQYDDITLIVARCV